MMLLLPKMKLLRAKKKTLHSTAKQAATIASKAQVKQLLLGHFSARYPHVSVILNRSSKQYLPIV